MRTILNNVFVLLTITVGPVIMATVIVKLFHFIAFLMETYL